MTNGLVTTKNPKNFFTYCDVIDHDVEELIKIEKYHTFKEPVPSEFKKQLAAKMDKYITSMINRTWRDVCQKIGLNADGKRDPRFYGPVLEELLNYKDKYSKSQLDLIDKFYISVFDESFRTIKEEPEVQEPEVQESEAAGTETPDTNDVPEDGLALENEDDIPEGISIEETAI